jgi:hypothetical protein
MKRCLTLFALIALLCGHSHAATPPPNIVLIFADDLGWQEPGFAGSDFCETPHLDRLAREGMVFRHAYASGANCQPSRACMLSGQYTPRHGVYAVGSTDRGPKTLMRMVPVPNHPNLPPLTVTLGEALKAAGYATGFFGKCHMKDSKTGKSEHAGFEVIKHSQHGLNSDKPEDPKAIFSITEAACAFIEEKRARPFFAYIPHYAVHSRLEGRAETLAHFKKQAAGKTGPQPRTARRLPRRSRRRHWSRAGDNQITGPGAKHACRFHLRQRRPPRHAGAAAWCQGRLLRRRHPRAHDRALAGRHRSRQQVRCARQQR